MSSNVKRSLAVSATLLVLLMSVGGVTAQNRNQPAGASPAIMVQAQALGQAFTYQGQLKKDGSLVNGTCDFSFALFDSQVAGTQIGNAQEVLSVAVTNGLFSVSLNGAGEFGATAFLGEARYLNVATRCPAGAGAWTNLAPRQLLSAAPYALSLRPGAAVSVDLPNNAVLQIHNLATSGYSSALYARAKSPDASAVYGLNQGGPGIIGESSSGTAAGVTAIGSGSTGTALLLQKGSLRVQSAGLGTGTPVFIHRAAAGNINASATCLDHPMTNGDPNAILIVTYSFNPGGGGGEFHDHAIGVLYESGGQFADRWCIINQDGANMLAGRDFNVLVVKP